MKIVIASDSYKGSKTSMQAAGLIEKGVRKVFPHALVVKVPVADGGEGTVNALVEGQGGKKVSVLVSDPLGRPVEAFYGVIEGKAVMEMAAASGLPLLSPDERNPLKTDTRGTGELILAAVKAGYTDITLGIGGSATNDGGAGMARSLGYRFLNAGGQELPPGGAALAGTVTVDDSGVLPLLRNTRIHAACDVDNPLLGENGASAVYGPQKGADPQMVKELDAALTRFADAVEQWKGKSLRNIPGSGAAGGLGFGLMAFCNAQIKSGIDTILDLTLFSEKIKDADLVITGEGNIDGQSLRGKVPIGVARRAQAAGIPVLAIAGGIGKGASAVYAHGIESIMSSTDRPMTLEEAMARTDECLSDAAERACRMLRMGMRIK